MRTHETVSRTVRALMAADQITQRDAAERLGMSQQALSGRLTGRTPWDVNDLDALAGLLDVEVLDLLAGPVTAAAGRGSIRAPRPPRRTARAGVRVRTLRDGNRALTGDYPKRVTAGDSQTRRRARAA